MDSSRDVEVSIRAVSDADAEAVAAFFAVAHEQDPVLAAIGAEDWRRFVALPQNHGGRDFRIAMTGGEIAAVATPSLRDHARPWIRHFRIVVAPARRRAGIGSRLLRHIAEMDAPEPALLQCLCPERWEAKAAFLAARGFAVIEHELDMARDAAGEAPRLRDVAIRALADPAPEAAAALGALHNRAYAGDPASVRLDAAAAAALFAGAALLVAELRGHIIGFCHVELGRAESWIENLVVAPERQGRGVGTALVAAALDLAARRACPRMRLAVSDRNAAAYVLYRRLGFAVIAKAARYRAAREKVLAALNAQGR
jgi:mycothiol synthase